METINRSAFDETVANMFSNPKYASNYLFYAHLLGQCRVVFDLTLPAPAGVNFMYDHFNLYINPNDRWVEIDPAKLTGKYKPKTRTTPDGKTEALFFGFNSNIPLEQRLGILKHEMLHILYNHIGRREDRDHYGFNISSDCAINQLIERSHLPEWVILPDQFPGRPVPSNLTAEQYYELILKEYKDGSGGGQGQGSGSQGNGPGNGQLGDHGKWDESEGDKELQDDIAKNMIERSISNTQKARGNLPSQVSDWLALVTRKREVNWKNVLRSIVGNKRIGSKRTLLRRDRRLPNFEWIKGRTKDRKFDLLLVSDVSGSVSDTALTALWGEVRHICDVTNTPVHLIQVDTHPCKPEQLKKNTRTIERKACGGTILHPALEMAEKYKLDYQAIVITTDGYLDQDDVQRFKDTGKRVIWLIEKDGQCMPEMSEGLMQAFQLKA